MKWHQQIRRPPWRTVVPVVVPAGVALLAWNLWRPGLAVTDGRHDRGQNGIWLAHGWLGGDEWFIRYGKTNEFIRYRDPSRIAALAQNLRAHHITEVYPHLCPATAEGRLPPVDAPQVERFLDALGGRMAMAAA